MTLVTRSRLPLLFAIAFSILVADQLTKYWAVAELTRVFEVEKAETFPERLSTFLSEENLERLRTRPKIVVRDYWQFKYVENPGAAWGLLGRVSESIRVPFFHLVSIVAIAFIIGFYRKLAPSQRLMRVALALVLGGALGNFVDRILRGYVIDFIDWHWRNDPALHWPTFNIADVGISVGVVLMLGETLLNKQVPEVSRADRRPDAVA